MIYKRFTDKSAEEWRQIYKVRVARDEGVPFSTLELLDFFSFSVLLVDEGEMVVSRNIGASIARIPD